MDSFGSVHIRYGILPLLLKLFIALYKCLHIFNIGTLLHEHSIPYVEYLLLKCALHRR
jgi:hypothetical protein